MSNGASHVDTSSGGTTREHSAEKQRRVELLEEDSTRPSNDPLMSVQRRSGEVSLSSISLGSAASFTFQDHPPRLIKTRPSEGGGLASRLSTTIERVEEDNPRSERSTGAFRSSATCQGAAGVHLPVSTPPSPPKGFTERSSCGGFPGGHVGSSGGASKNVGR